MIAEQTQTSPDAPPVEQKKIGLVGAKERHRQAKEARRPYEADWFLNMAFFQGEQWVAYNGQGLYRPRVKSRVTITDNRVQPAVRTEVARLTKTRPGWAATPRAIDDQAINDAQAATRLLDWSYDFHTLAPKRREATTWSRITGAGFLKTTFDQDAVAGGVDVLLRPDGQPIVNPQTGRPLRTGEIPQVDAMPGVQTKRVGGGDVRHEVRAPFDIFPDPLATSLADCRWLIDESVRSVEEVKQDYGIDVTADAPAQVGIVESRFLAHGVDAARGEQIGVRVFELWEKPSPWCPDGRIVVWTENRLLSEEANPYGRLPYAMATGIPVPGRFWPDAIVTQLRPIQTRLNKLLSQIAENISRFGNPAILLDALSKIDYHGVPGEQIRHNATAPQQLPQFLTPPPMSPQAFQLMEYAQQALREISGQFEVSSGTVPAGVTAASAISLLQEQDSTRLGPDVEALENFIAEVGQQTLDLMAKFFTNERIIVIVGEDGIADVDTFRADATFQVPTISVVHHSTFPRSIAAKQAAIRDILNMLFQYGVPVDAAALAKILREMQVGGLENLVQSYTADVNQIAREHIDAARGQGLFVNQYDDHGVHVQGHKDFAKSSRFKTWPVEAQTALIAHIQLHENQLLLAAQAAMDGAPQLPGAPQITPGTVPTQPSGDPLPRETAGGPQGAIDSNSTV